MSPKFQNLAFVDIETTGTDFIHDRIIEISVLRVQKGKLVKTFTSLINPELPVSPFITEMTGITQKDLDKKPTFFDIKDQILDALDGCIFVAHNVRFDYGFIKTEFKRLGKNFRSKTLCTVKLSRHLFPHEFSHNLDAIIDRFQIDCINRHRAYDDAKVIFDFYQYLLKNIPKKDLENAFKIISHKSTLPPILEESEFELLPENPGVYIFYGQNDLPIYIGKSQNIKNRVLSHFQQSSTSSKELQLSTLVKSIKTIETPGDLSASILESNLIKTRNPLLNRQLRSVKKYFILKKITTPENYFSVEIEETSSIPIKDLENILGIFNSKKKIQNFLEVLAREHNLCSKLLHLDDSKGQCFLHQIDICYGACIEKESFLKYNLRFLEAFSKKTILKWPFSSPIIITETNPLNNLSEQFIVDQWCLLGNIKSEDELHNINFLKDDYVFEYDIYKIIKRFIKNPQNHSQIKRIKTTDLNKLLD